MDCSICFGDEQQPEEEEIPPLLRLLMLLFIIIFVVVVVVVVVVMDGVTILRCTMKNPRNPRFDTKTVTIV